MLLECSRPISLIYQQTPAELLLLILGLFRAWRNNLEVQRQRLTAVLLILNASVLTSTSQCSPPPAVGTCAMQASPGTGEEAMPEIQLRPGTLPYQGPMSI